MLFGLGRAIGAGALLGASALASPAWADDGVATALVVSVDVSGSVDERRYTLQMEGIAEALEDPAVLAAITANRGGIYFSLVTWADSARMSVPWRRIASKADAAAAAALVRVVPRMPGNFTCLGGMMGMVTASVVPAVPVQADRVVVDVSGDGIDNCVDPDELHAQRDGLLATGSTINGLPILVPGENDVVGVGAYRAPGYGLRALPEGTYREGTTLDRWFREHVVGGPGSFLMTAHGYGDFARALRQKFVSEISGLPAETGSPTLASR
ncbi:DUF1194 domain-containing protein [Methylobacterium haplocladii]|uniref:tRNA delta(2)-isopentenylpyrophosphate transferase n=1 Tax=Methylobacterium haplocladii TaxID=1176176 RepID=A0A512IKM6_9HYPH|nr:DUF1194 domain-containing protein [Methylobacterium haplocladii]GEO98244.1 hypothetical protein MHA02_06320 [Methylobacterium haplocladii]GJD84361.1 hypothetical protein HPGCJGGD_2237 [Methylobacterium haplocladii]GLS60536.1 hypothetical protein GCM10007887_32150 [Methylobacterium haplocladii]